MATSSTPRVPGNNGDVFTGATIAVPMIVSPAAAGSEFRRGPSESPQKLFVSANVIAASLSAPAEPLPRMSLIDDSKCVVVPTTPKPTALPVTKLLSTRTAPPATATALQLV